MSATVPFPRKLNPKTESRIRLLLKEATSLRQRLATLEKTVEDLARTIIARPPKRTAK